MVNVPDDHSTEPDDDSDEAGAPSPSVSFLATKARLKKEIASEMSKRGAKKYAFNELKMISDKLSPEDKTELKRTGCVETLEKNYKQQLKDLKDLQEQLTDTDQDFVLA